MVEELQRIAQARSIPFTEGDVASVAAYEKGTRLRILTKTPGWQDFLDVMEQRVADAEFELINSTSTEPNVVMSLQKRARSMRELFQQCQAEVEFLIREAKNQPDIMSLITNS